jgi:4-hydroxy-tetrahydrodipicolinate synthase
MNFKGTGVALVTPFTQSGTIDFPALEKLVHYVTEGGVDFLVVLGTTAETPTLTLAEQQEVLDFVVKVNNKKLPIVLGVGGNNTQNVIHTIDAYKGKGIDGLLCVVPYYNKPSQEGIYQHFKAIASSTQLPIILYNVPGRTVTNMNAGICLRLAKEFNNIVAIKEASGNLSQCMELVKGAPEEFNVLSGDDDLVLPQIAIGMKGVISVAANGYPKTFTTMVNAALKGDIKEAQALHYKMLDATKLLFAEGNPTGIKYFLSKKGIIENHLRLPLIPASESLEKTFTPYIEALS